MHCVTLKITFFTIGPPFLKQTTVSFTVKGIFVLFKDWYSVQMFKIKNENSKSICPHIPLLTLCKYVLNWLPLLYEGQPYLYSTISLGTQVLHTLLYCTAWRPILPVLHNIPWDPGTPHTPWQSLSISTQTGGQSPVCHPRIHIRVKQCPHFLSNKWTITCRSHFQYK